MRPSSAETSEPAWVKRKMLSMKRRTSLPSSSRKYSATVRPVRATRRRAPGGSAEEADLAAAQVGLDEVDDLDAGLEHLELDRLLLEAGRVAMDGQALAVLHRPHLVHGLADDVEHAAEGSHADGDGDRPAGVGGPHAAHHAFGGQ